MNPPEPLPHAYPFRFADRTLEKTGPASGRVRMAFTAHARRAEAGFLSPFTLAELLAQAALLLEGGDPEIGKTGFLAGFSGFEVDRWPEAGDLLVVDVSMAGRLGPIVKFDGTIHVDGGEPIARGSITVRQGDAPR